MPSLRDYLPGTGTAPASLDSLVPGQGLVAAPPPMPMGPDLTQHNDLTEAAGMTEVGKGFRSGRLGSDANYLASQEFSLRAAGRHDEADAIRNQIGIIQQRAGVFAPRVQKVEDAWANPTDAPAWLGGVVGQVGSSMVDSVATGVGASKAAQLVGLLPHPVAKTIGRAGSWIGAGAAAVPNVLNARGETANQMVEDPTLMANTTAEQRNDAAWLSGGAQGLVDTAMPSVIINRLGGAGIAKGVHKLPLVPRIAADMVGEGAQEVVQEGMKKGTLGYLNPNRDTSGDASDYLNSFASGLGMAPHAAASIAVDNGFRRLGVKGDGERGDDIDLSGKDITTQLAAAAKGGKGRSLADSIAYSELLHGTEATPDVTDQSGLTRRRDALLSELAKYPNAAALAQPLTEMNDRLSLLRGVDAMDEAADFLAPKLGLTTEQLAKKGGKLKNSLQVDPKNFGKGQIDTSEMPARTPEQQAAVVEAERQHKTQTTRLRSLLENTYTQQHADAGSTFNPSIKKLLGSYAPELAAIMSPGVAEKPTAGEIARAKRIGSSIGSALGEKANGALVAVAQRLGVKNSPVFDAMHDEAVKVAEHRKSGGHAVHAQHMTERDAAAQALLDAAPEFDARMAKQGVDLRLEDNAHLREQLLIHMEDHADGEGVATQAQLEEQFGKEAYAKMMEIVGGPIAPRHTAVETAEQKVTPKLSSDDVTTDGSETTDFEKRGFEKNHTAVDPGSLVFGHSQTEARSAADAFKPGADGKLMKLIPADRMDSDGRRSLSVMQLRMAQALRSQSKGYVYGRQKDGKVGTSAKELMDRQGVHGDQRVALMGQYLAQENPGADHTDFVETVKALPALRRVDELMSEAVQGKSLSTPEMSRSMRGQLKRVMNYVANPEQFLSTDAPLSAPARAAQNLAIAKAVHKAHADIRGMIDGHESLAPMVADFKATHGRAPSTHELADHFFGNRFLVHAEKLSDRDYLKIDNDEFTKLHREGTKLLRAAEHQAHESGGNVDEHKAGMNLIHFRSLAAAGQKKVAAGDRTIAIPAHKLVAWVRDMRNKHTGDTRTGDNTQSYSDNEKADQYLDDLKEGINALMAQKLVRGTPWIVNAAGGKEMFSEGMPPSLSVGDGRTHAEMKEARGQRADEKLEEEIATRQAKPLGLKSMGEAVADHNAMHERDAEIGQDEADMQDADHVRESEEMMNGSKRDRAEREHLWKMAQVVLAAADRPPAVLNKLTAFTKAKYVADRLWRDYIGDKYADPDGKLYVDPNARKPTHAQQVEAHAKAVGAILSYVTATEKTAFDPSDKDKTYRGDHFIAPLAALLTPNHMAAIAEHYPNELEKVKLLQAKVASVLLHMAYGAEKATITPGQLKQAVDSLTGYADAAHDLKMAQAQLARADGAAEKQSAQAAVTAAKSASPVQQPAYKQLLTDMALPYFEVARRRGYAARSADKTRNEAVKNPGRERHFITPFAEMVFGEAPVESAPAETAAQFAMREHNNRMAQAYGGEHQAEPGRVAGPKSSVTGSVGASDSGKVTVDATPKPRAISRMPKPTPVYGKAAPIDRMQEAWAMYLSAEQTRVLSDAHDVGDKGVEVVVPQGKFVVENRGDHTEVVFYPRRERTIADVQRERAEARANAKGDFARTDKSVDVVADTAAAEQGVDNVAALAGAAARSIRSQKAEGVVAKRENNATIADAAAKLNAGATIQQVNAGIAAKRDAAPKTINIWHGSGENAALSNLADRPFQFNNRMYVSVEHAYQSNKSGKFDQATYDKYKVAGRKIPGTMGTKTEGGWNLKLMKRLISESFKSNPDAMEKLLATGDAKLTHTQARGVWAAEFPRILTEVRSEAAAGDTGLIAVKAPAAPAPKTPVFDALPSHKPGQKTMTYAGIGSRRTTPDVLRKMTAAAKQLAAMGYTLQSGGAQGADSAFEQGAEGKAQVFKASDATDQTRKIAKEIHPNPGALGIFPLNLMARNTNQIFGADLKTPVDFVLAWTPDGAESTAERNIGTGGTGQAIDMASRKGIPVINMAKPDWQARVRAIVRAGEAPKTEAPKAEAPKTEAPKAEALAQSVRDMPMNYRDGTNGLAMRPEYKGKSTMDLIREGARTATTGARSRFAGLNVGDVFTVVGGDGERIKVRLTQLPERVNSMTAEEWSKREGWAPKEQARYMGAYQARYELVGKPVVPSTTATTTLSSAIAQRLEYLNNPPADYTTEKAQAIKEWAARQLSLVQAEVEKIEKNVRFGVGEVGEYDDRLTELYDRRLDLKLLDQKADDVLEGDASLKGFEGDTVKNSLQTADTARALTPEEIKTFDKNKLGSAAPVSKDNEIVSTRIALRRMLGDKVTTLFEESFPDMQGGADWNETKAIIRIATASSVPMMQRGYHEAMHAFYSLILKNSPEAQAMIERVTSDPKIVERMAAMLKDSPEAVEQMRNDAEERAAYAYQFWAAGMLDIGKKPETFFEKVQAFMRRVLGAVRENDKAMAIFTAFHDGKLTEPSAAGLAITKVMETGEWRAKMLKRFDKQAQAAYSEVMAAINIGMNSESPTARTIAMMFYSHPSVAKTAGKPGYIDSAQLARHQYENLIQAALRPLMGDNLERDMAELAQVLNGKAKAVQPHVEKAAQDIYAALHRFHKYAREAGVDIGVRDDGTYFPRVIQLETMIEKKAEFIDMLVTNYPSAMAQIGKSLAAQGKPAAPEDAAALIHQSYIDRGGIENAALSVMREDGVLNPFFASQNERKLHWIRDEHIAPFLSTDVVSTLTRYFSQGTRSAEYVRRFGEDGQKLKDMMARLGDVRFISKTGQVENYTEDGPVVKELKAAAVKAKAAKPDEWVDRRMEDLQRSFGAMEGSLGKDISAGYRQFQGNIMTYQILRTLPLSLFSAVLDPNGLRVAGGTSDNMWYAYRRGLLGVFNTWKDLVKGNPLGIKDPDKYEAAANAMGVIAPTMYLEQYGGVHSSEYSAGAARKINHKFFLANGLTSWDRDMRIAATKAAMESIVSNEANTIPAHSARWLKELGLAQNDGVVRTDADGELVTNKHVLAQMRADEKGTTKDEEMAQAEKDAHKIAVAVNRWVARAIMAPNAALRPSRASDPHYAMFFQLKSFTYAFTETTLKYAMAEAEEGNLNAGAQLMRGVPIMIAADMTKALLTNGGSLPGYMANWTMADWVLHGINRSGNLGTPQLGLDALHGAHGSIMGAVGTVGGPTVSQGIDLAAGALNGNLGTEVGKSIPFFNKIGQAAHSVGGMLDMGE